MEVLGIIPARGGSKAIPLKNMAKLAERPLLAYTCDAASTSKRLTRTVLTTDDSTIARLGRQYGIDVPFLRPKDLSQDETPMLPVLQHTLLSLQETESYKPEVVVLLQPTSPLRLPRHIDESVDLLLKTGAESVVSVVQVPHQFNPVSLMNVKEGKLVPYLTGKAVLRRQEKPRFYARNGPAVLSVRCDVLLRKKSLYGDDCRPYIMEPRYSVDIDEPGDLEFAEYLLSRFMNEKLSPSQK